MTNPLVSVVMSVYNEEPRVLDAMRSILQQTYQNLELIVIDDYSTDRSLEICRSVEDARVRVYAKSGEPRRLAASRNIGVAMARGEYIIWQDADDLAHPQRVEKQLRRALEAPERRVVGCCVKQVEKGVERLLVLPETDEEIRKGFQRLFNRTTIVAGTILAPRKIFLDFPYRERFPYMQDWDQALRMYESGRVEFYNCPEALYTYFIRPKGVVFQPEWLDCNLFVRHSQYCRRKGRPECESLEAFLRYLDAHPLEKAAWGGLRALIRLKHRLKGRKMADSITGPDKRTE